MTKLKGIMIRGDCEVIDEPEEVWNVMREIRRFEGAEPAAPDNAVLKERAKKRAILKITSGQNLELGPQQAAQGDVLSGPWVLCRGEDS